MSSWNTDATANRFRSSYINGFLEVSGNFIINNNGAPGIRMNGNNTDGVYITYYPDGSTKRGYVGFPGLGNVNFITQNEYTNGTIENQINNISKLKMTTSLTTITNTQVVVNANMNNSGGITLYNASGGITLNSNTDQVYIQAPVGSTSVNKIVCGSQATTITNTNVDVVGNLNATRYATGTSAAPTPLLTYFIWGQRTILNQAVAGTSAYSMWLGNNSVTSATLISTPNIQPKSQRCCVWFDSGTFTGGGVTTVYFNLLSSGGGVLSSSGTFTFTSTSTAIASQAMPASFLPVLNGTLGIQAVVSNTAAISVSTKNMYVQVWFSQ